ncbi:MAG: glycosyltransferase family 39 protein [Candidatus Levybacteria bacterium]|nr:glycosyltransferase family 39 protein [Candidatus Levybacteria bacterium]
MIFFKKIAPFLFVIILSFLTIKPLFNPGFFPIHDDTQVARVFEMKLALLDGQFPVRWVPDLGYGYGYPIFNFYAPLTYYAGSIINIFGFDALISTKIIMGLGIILSGIFMYILTSYLFGKIAGVTSALFYMYAPFHALDIYIRGDISESWAYTFIPLVFYGLLRSAFEKKWKYIAIGAISYAGVILSHNLTAMMITPFILVFILFYFLNYYREKRINTFINPLIAIVLGLMISAFYWIPALFEMKYTNVISQIGGGADFRDHFVCVEQLWQSPWGFGGSAPGCIDGLSFKIGKMHLLLSLLGFLSLIWLVLKTKFDNDKYKNTILFTFFSTAGILLSIFLMLEISKPIWEQIPLMAFFQYPWRFLLLTSFFSAVLTGFFLWFTEKKLKTLKTNKFIIPLVVSILLFSLIFFNAKLFNPQTTEFKTEKDYTSPSNLRWRISKISDEYMPKGFNKPRNREDIPSKIIEIKEDEGRTLFELENSKTLRYFFDISKRSEIQLNIAYFPAWQFYIDGKKTTPSILENGISLIIEPGRHELYAEFVQTSIEKFANALSLTGLFVFIIGIIFSTRKIVYGQKNR